MASIFSGVWLAYGAFCVERKKYANATKHLTKAAAAVRGKTAVRFGRAPSSSSFSFSFLPLPVARAVAGSAPWKLTTGRRHWESFRG